MGIVSSAQERARSYARTINRGGRIAPPHSSPFHMLARTCPACGRWIATPPTRLRKSDHRKLIECRHCKTQRTVRNNRKRYATSAQHRKRHADLIARRIVEQQVQLLDNAVNARKEWTGPELEIAARSGLTAAQVAAMLGRSLYAVRAMRHKLHVDPRKARMGGTEVS